MRYNYSKLDVVLLLGWWTTSNRNKIVRGRKNVFRNKKRCVFLGKSLDTSHSFGMLSEFFCEKLGKLLTDKFLRIQSRSKLKTQNSKLKTQNSKLKTQNSKLRVFYRRNSFKYSTFMWSMETGGKSFGRVFSLVFFRLNRFP